MMNSRIPLPYLTYVFLYCQPTFYDKFQQYFFHKPPLFHVTLPHINLTLFSPFLSPQLPLFPQLTSSSNFHNVSLPFSSRFFSLSWACHPFFLLHVPFFHPSYSSHLCVLVVVLVSSVFQTLCKKKKLFDFCLKLKKKKFNKFLKKNRIK